MVRSRRYAWYVLGLLTTINFINYVDRNVLQGMYDSLRARFGMDDWQLGLLTTALYGIHGLMIVPFGWAADRWDRRKILACGVIIWSLATLASAFTVGFVSLLLMRGLVGVGEAAYGPIANALLCDTFRPHEKARVVAVFGGGMFIGGTVGIFVGVKLGFPLAFLVVAVPGLILGLLAARLDVPPLRLGCEERPSVRPSLGRMVADARRTLGVPTLRWMTLAGVLISFAAGGYITWFIDFIIHFKHFNKDSASLTVGLVAITGGPLGVLTGGLLADRLHRRWAAGRTLTMGFGFMLALPFGLGALYIDSALGFFVCAWLLMFFIPWYTGPMAATIDDVVDDRDASTAQASFSFMLHLLGTCPASFLVGVASNVWGLRTALLLPTLALGFAGTFAFMASRHVAADRLAREQRRRPAAIPSEAVVASAGAEAVA